MHVHEFAYVRACDHVCHRMRVYIFASKYMRIRASAWLRAWECVRMCEHMWLCVCVHVYMRTRVMHLCVHVCVRMCVHECVCGRVCQSNVCVCVQVCGYVRARGCARVPACACTCIICVNACYASFYHLYYNSP